MRGYKPETMNVEPIEPTMDAMSGSISDEDDDYSHNNSDIYEDEENLDINQYSVEDDVEDDNEYNSQGNFVTRRRRQELSTVPI